MFLTDQLSYTSLPLTDSHSVFCHQWSNVEPWGVVAGDFGELLPGRR